MIKKALLSALLIWLLMPVRAFSQNVEGHWYGVGIVQTTREYNNYMSEMILKQKGKLVSGTLNYYFKDSLVKVPLSGSFDALTNRMLIKPFSMIYYLSQNARNSIDCNMSGSFVLLASKTETVLSGSLVSDAEHRYTTPPISFRFQKSADTTELAMKDEPVPIQRDTVVTVVAAPRLQETEAFDQREKIFTKELEVTNSSLRLELYDNGEIDYDSVSLFFNNKRILPKTMLTHRAIRITIELDPNLEYNELSMFAENLGMIPPNTGALIVYDGKTRYETLLTSDLSKSATLRIKKKK
jgi:hypothetical protein